MGEDKALITGTPYLDALKRGTFDRANSIHDMAEAYPEIAGNDAEERPSKVAEGRPAKVVLYVPTYRKSAHADEEAGRGDALRDALGAEGYLVLEKKHPIDAAAGESGLSENTTVIPASALGMGLGFASQLPESMSDGSLSPGFSAEELMYRADIVVTDYSSLAITAALLGKPLDFYIYDIEEYRNSPGLNIDPEEEYGKYAARDAANLARLIRASEYDYDRDYERGFAEKYVETYDGTCTERLTAAVRKVISPHLP
jgi:CDP-glycerol glycerophosphotransferase (TagB/SpsB family)